MRYHSKSRDNDSHSTQISMLEELYLCVSTFTAMGPEGQTEVKNTLSLIGRASIIEWIKQMGAQ
jgi:hypothetical protein